MELKTQPFGEPVFKEMSSVDEDVQEPVALWSVEAQGDQFSYQMLGGDHIKCWAEIQKLHLQVGIPLLQVYQAQMKMEMTSSVERLGLYANWNGLNDGGSIETMWSLTTLLKHFMIVDVSATEQKSLRHPMIGFLALE